LYGAKQLVGDNTIPLRTVRKVMVSSAADAKKDNCPKDMQNLVFRIDTWDKYYLFACGSARDRELLVRFFQWRTKQNASDDDDDDDGDGASLMLAESVARFENSSTVSSPTASRRSVSPVGSHTSHTSPSNRGASQQQSLQQQQRSSFVVTDTRSSSGGATRATTSQRNLPPAPPPPPAPPAQALDGDVLDDVTFEEEAERIGLVVNIEIKARAAMLAAYKSFAGSTTAATATEEVKSTAGEQPAEAKAAAPLPSEPPAPAPPPPSTTNSPPNNSSSPAVTQTSSVNAPPAGTSANRRRASMSSSAGAAAVIIQQQQQRAEAELNRQRLQREMEAHAAFVTKGAWMHKPRSKPAGGASSLFNLGGSSWNKRFVWVANNRVCYGEKQGKVEKDVLLSTIRSVHVVSSDTMKAEKAPASMQELGWRLIAAERTIIFAAADAAARKHFVEFLSPKAVTPSSTKAGVRGGADDSRNEHLIDYADDYDEGQEDLYEEEEEEDPPFADADNAGGDNMAAMTLEGSRSGGGGDGSGVAGDGGRGGGERAPSATSSAAPSPSNRAANGGAVSNQSLAGGVPLSPGLGPARRSSLVRAKALPVLGKPKEPEVPLATLRSFVSRVDDGVVLNKTDGLIGAALATGEGLVVRKVGGIDERFVGKAALVLSAASKLRSKQRIAVPAHVVVETDTGTVVTVGPCEDGKPGLIAISIVGPNR
jgi:hypothetical protein